MDLIAMPSSADGAFPAIHQAHGARLRLYVARSTPNSVRAEHNLSSVLAGLSESFVPPAMEIIDIFAQPKRAITDGVVVTPTLIGLAAGKRIVLLGDLADHVEVRRTIEDLIGHDAQLPT